MSWIDTTTGTNSCAFKETLFEDGVQSDQPGVHLLSSSFDIIFSLTYNSWELIQIVLPTVWFTVNLMTYLK